MLLNLSKIIDCPGVVPFETALDLSDLSFGGCCPAQEPVVEPQRSAVWPRPTNSSMLPLPLLHQ